MKVITVATFVLFCFEGPRAVTSLTLQTSTIIHGVSSISHHQRRNGYTRCDSHRKNSIDDYDDDDEKLKGSTNQFLEKNVIKTRRNVLQNVASITTAASIMGRNVMDANAIIATTTATATSTIVESEKTSATSLSPKITHKVHFNVRISRADGTFYVRDDPPGTIPTPDNQVFTGTLTFGLYGNNAPTHVSKFLNYVVESTLSDPFEDVPTPSYSRSLFTTFLQSNGVLIGGTIPGLHLTTFNGASALEYRGRITPASLWIEKGKASSSSNNNGNDVILSHSKAGLLTHRNLDVLSDFGITTREARELDSTNTVFGEVIPTESSKAFFSRIVDLPTYSNTRPMSVGTTLSKNGDVEDKSKASNAIATNGAVDEVASSFYSFQKDLFRSAAKTFGDTRLDNIYEGKILRRVEVTSISLETM